MAIQLTDTQAHLVRGPALSPGGRGRVHRQASNEVGVCTWASALGDTGSMDGP